MSRAYKIILDGEQIGTTRFEKADVPKGVVFGIIDFENQSYGCQYFKGYCDLMEIKPGFYDTEEQLILLENLQGLTVLSEGGQRITSEGNQLTGMSNDGFEIMLVGIALPFYENEFPHHVKEYHATLGKKYTKFQK